VLVTGLESRHGRGGDGGDGREDGELGDLHFERRRCVVDSF